MRVVVILTLAGLGALILALATGSTWPALVVIVLALAGIVVLLRDWRSDRSGRNRPSAQDSGAGADGGAPLCPDDFAPDISTDPAGPSSDARAD
ncbi:MAG: hypothetical protein QG655_2677 [Actinomycetota bacterium]|jgi:hypothetical protein|nr:hypothetical protein [Actinomycetota bacterium]